MIFLCAACSWLWIQRAIVLPGLTLAKSDWQIQVVVAFSSLAMSLHTSPQPVESTSMQLQGSVIDAAVVDPTAATAAAALASLYSAAVDVGQSHAALENTVPLGTTTVGANRCSYVLSTLLCRYSTCLRLSEAASGLRRQAALCTLPYSIGQLQRQAVQARERQDLSPMLQLPASCCFCCYSCCTLTQACQIRSR